MSAFSDTHRILH